MFDHKYTEKYNPHTYTFTGVCLGTGKPVTVTVLAEELWDYQNGHLIQNAFPQLTPSEREWLMNGYHTYPWELEEQS